MPGKVDDGFNFLNQNKYFVGIYRIFVIITLIIIIGLNSTVVGKIGFRGGRQGMYGYKKQGMGQRIVRGSDSQRQSMRNKKALDIRRSNGSKSQGFMGNSGILDIRDYPGELDVTAAMDGDYKFAELIAAQPNVSTANDTPDVVQGFR